MSWEEIADSRMQEIRRLRAIIRCSKLDSFLFEHAAGLYNMCRESFFCSRAKKADDAPLTECEIKRWAEMEIIADLIATIGVMDRGEFIEQAKTFRNEKETENES